MRSYQCIEMISDAIIGLMDDMRSRDEKVLFAILFPRVREVLMRDWDPIGITDFDDAPEDEYDDYARTLCGELFDLEISEESIRDYLAQVAQEHMGLPPNRDAIERTARAIIGLRIEFFGAS
jgi:hypothetical protein